MDLQKCIENYAELIIVSAINIKKGQCLMISANITSAEFVRLLTKKAYEHGAEDVYVNFSDTDITRMRYDNAPLSCFENVSEWFAMRYNEMARKDYAFLNIISDDPDAFAGIDPQKPAASRKAIYAACEEYNAKMDIDACQWCIAGVPSEKWAKKVFPNDAPDDAVTKLWEAILKTSRADTPNPIAAWENHKQTFNVKKEWLNSLNIDSLHYKSSNGTDFTVGLPDGYIFEGGGATTPEGVYFFPNVPTEELFTVPDLNRADGTVVNALPLIYNGSVIDGFKISFKNGRISDYSAEKGYDFLKAMIETDEGSHHLGEVALIPHNSPISNMDLLFYSTLYDENASCHLAIGMGFPTCVKGGVTMSREESAAHGVNQSAVHVDFMIGSPDLEITARDKTGKEIPILRNGNWA